MFDDAKEISSASSFLKKWIKSQKQYDYFDGFFDIEKMTQLDVYNFLYSHNYSSFKKTLKNLVKNNWKISNSYYDFFVNYENKKDDFINFTNSTRSLNLFRNLVKCIIFKILESKCNKITDFDKKYEEEKVYSIFKNERHKEEFYFRGQTNAQWNLIPSMIRTLPKSKPDGYILNINSIHYLYSKSKLIDKYNMCFPNKEIKSPADINYDFLSLMQHAISYSPFLDFTTSYEVAASFAVRKNNPNDFLLRKSAIYILNIKNTNVIYEMDEVNREIQNLNIKYLNEKIIPGRIYFVHDFEGNSYVLDFSKMENIINELRPDIIIVDSVRNDRMRNQKGKFVLFNNYTTIQGKVFYALNKDFKIKKHELNKEDKDKLIKLLSNDSEFLKYSYLMNPYQIFED